MITFIDLSRKGQLTWVRCWAFWKLPENTPVSAGPANTSRIVSLTLAKASARGQYSAYVKCERKIAVLNRKLIEFLNFYLHICVLSLKHPFFLSMISSFCC